MTAFTLQNLVRALTDAGFEVVASGVDANPEFAAAMALAGHPYQPRFFVRVEKLGDDVIDFTTQVMKVVWDVFERGQMEFVGGCRGDRTHVYVTEIEKKATP